MGIAIHSCGIDDEVLSIIGIDDDIIDHGGSMEGSSCVLRAAKKRKTKDLVPVHARNDE
jgi:hypothetical protein